MKTKVLVLTSGNVYERRGFFNAVVCRTKYLREICDLEIDMLLLSTYEPWLVRTLRHTQKQTRPKQWEVDGICMHIDWFRFSLLDYLLNVKFHKDVILKKLHNRVILDQLKEYSFIIAHSQECGELAKLAKEKYGIPYSVTWHGSDIHSVPFVNSSVCATIKSVIEDADCNFFVSKALLDTSESITNKGVKRVLYNGYNINFRKYSDEKRALLKKLYGVQGKKVVVFAGNFLAVKNILTVPLIFQSIAEKVQNVEFWMIGGGKYFHQVEKMVKNLPIRLWGQQEPEVMPDFLNSSDVLILPSINEGLPLIVVEGLACGCNVVGSLVGGIPEVIGEENCVKLDDPKFVEKFADKVVAYLKPKNQITQGLKPDFNWKKSAIKELEVIKGIIGC